MNNSSKKYCNSLTFYSRFKTREVSIGHIPLGGENPIRIQSMTTTDTMNTIATVEQTIRMVDAGCEYVRITAPSINDAENLSAIKDELKIRGCNVPLIADIHFTPNAAEAAARIVEKVRVNPGNYVDRKKFKSIEYTDIEYNAELERIRERFSPLVKICKEYGTAMRIGTNHGSLSDRIMSRFGDTPEGMVESALEFVRICQELNYFDIVLSMKSSNTKVMVQAYRLLINKMILEGMNYPIHLGVTEAGGGEDGRIKSAVGIGALLEDGIGDTIRVSLTEEPENESPVAIKLAERYSNRSGHKDILKVDVNPIDPFNYNKRVTFEVEGIGGDNVPVIVADFSMIDIVSIESLQQIGYTYSEKLDKWNLSDTAADLLYLGKNEIDFDPPKNLKLIYDYNKVNAARENGNYIYLYKSEHLNEAIKSSNLCFVEICIDDLTPEFFDKVKNKKNIIFVITTNNIHGAAEQRRIFIELINQKNECPVIIKREYADLDEETLMLYSATDFGTLLLDGLGDGIWLGGINSDNKFNQILFGILQATRTRISKTEYIACPSCGRTLFDLVEVTAKIRKKTEHLKEVKIGIMGCIVNGPGEMADADYGYVGSGVRKITLYRGKEVVKKGINAELAVEALIELIKEDGRWVEPNKNNA